MFLLFLAATTVHADNPYSNRGTESNLAGNFQTSAHLTMQLRNAASFDWPGETRPRLLVTFDFYVNTAGETIGTDRDAEVYRHNDQFSHHYPVFHEDPVSNLDLWTTGTTPPEPNTTGAIFADFDNDGHQDFYAPNPEGHTLYRFNPDEGKYEDATSLINYLPGSEFNETITASWGDYDGDGFVDLFVSSAEIDWSSRPDEVRLYRNEGGTAFTPVSGSLGISESAKDILTPLWADFDGDHDVDLLLVQSYPGLGSQSFYFDNQIREAAQDMVSTSSFISACADDFENENNIAVCNDFNNDGLLDVAHHHRHGLGVFTLKSDLTGFEEQWADQDWYDDPADPEDIPFIYDLAAFDADHDGDMDLVTSMQRPELDDTIRWPRIHLQETDAPGGSHFLEIGDFPSDHSEYGHDQKGFCAADFTMDGLTELFFTRDVGPGDSEGHFFYDLDNSHGGDFDNTNWVGVKLEALGNLSNRDCLGATVIVTAADGTSFTQAQVVDGGSGRASQNRPWLTYGLGSYAGPVDVTVKLPNRGVVPGGSTYTWEDLGSGQYHELTMEPFSDAGVQITLLHDPADGSVTMRVKWITEFATEWQEDTVVFHTEQPDAIDPGLLVYQVTEDPGYGSTGPYFHVLEIPDLPCDTTKKYYIHVENRAIGALTAQFSPIFDSQTKKCLSGNDPGDLPDDPVWP